MMLLGVRLGCAYRCTVFVDVFVFVLIFASSFEASFSESFLRQDSSVFVFLKSGLNSTGRFKKMYCKFWRFEDDVKIIHW